VTDLNRALLWSLKQPLKAGAIFLIVTVFFAFQLPRLEIDASIEGLMLERDPAREYYEQVKRTFGGDSLTLVVIKADDVFTREVLGIVERLSRRLERVDGVTRVESLATVDHVAEGEDGFTIAPLIAGDVPDDPAALARIRTSALGDHIFLRNLVARDGRAIALAVYTDAAKGDRTFNERFSRAVDALLAGEAAPGITLYQVGAPLTKATVVSYLKDDQALLVPLSALTLFIVLLLAFRTPQGVVVPLVTGLSSVIWGCRPHGRVRHPDQHDHVGGAVAGARHRLCRGRPRHRRVSPAAP
jgi:predicted RND superfamily exporter protein